MEKEDPSNVTAPLDDLRLRAAQLELDRERFRFEQDLERRKLKSTFYSSGIIIALVGVLGVVLGNFVQGCYNWRLERQKSQSLIILKAIETGSAKDAANNLLFLVRAGLLDDPAHRIEELLKKSEDVPVLPSRLGQDGPYLKADIASYCRDRYGPAFRAVDGECSDGSREYRVDAAQVCGALTGSADYSIDPASLEIHCSGRGEPAKEE